MDTLEKFVNFVGSLIGAIKEGCSTEDVAHRYKEMFNKQIKYTEMGCNSLEDLLKVCEQRGKIYRRDGRWFVRTTEDNKHMVDLINNTKSTKNKKGNIKYYGRITPKANFSKVPHTSQFKTQLKSEPKTSVKSRQPVPTVYNAAFMKQPESSSENYQTENPTHRSLPPPPGFEDKTGRCEGKLDNDFANASDAFSFRHPNEKSNSSSLSSFDSNIATASRDRFAKGCKRLRATVEMCGDETSLSGLKQAYEKRYHIPLDSAEFHRLFGVDMSNPERLQRILNGCLDLKEEHDEWIFSVPADDFDDTFFDALDDLQIVNKTFNRQEKNAYNDGNEGISAVSDSPLQTSRRPSSSRGVNCYGPKRAVDHREDEAFGDRRDIELNKGSHLDSIESQKASSGDELDYMSLGNKIFGDVIYNGPIKISALGDFFSDVHGLRVDPVASGDNPWIGIVKKIMDTGRFPSLVVCRNEIGLREHFLEMGLTKEEEEELLAANLAYRILKNNDGRMLYLELFDDLRKWDITFDHILFYKFITKFTDTFECEFSTNGHFLYLTEGAKPPSPNGVVPNSNVLSPMVCTDVLSSYRSGELPEKKPINLAKLDVVTYRDGMRRFIFIFSLSEFDIKKKKFHTELYEYYNSRWQDEDLMIKLNVGDHAVFYDPIRDYVRRIYYVEEEGNGNLRVYLMDDLEYASIKPSQIRKLTEEFASVPSFGVVAFSSPFQFFDHSGLEFWRTFDKVRERLSGGANSTTPAFIRLYSNPEEGIRRVMHLFHESTKTSFPNCLIADSFIQLQDKKWKFYNSREEEPDDDMWNSGCKLSFESEKKVSITKKSLFKKFSGGFS